MLTVGGTGVSNLGLVHRSGREGGGRVRALRLAGVNELSIGTPPSINPGGVARIARFFAGWRNGIGVFLREVEKKNLKNSGGATASATKLPVSTF